MSLYLGTTPIAALQNQSFGDIVDALYPVGSIYIGTTSTCPLASIKGTWTNIGTGIMKSSSTVPVKGNGMAMGITDGSTNFGVIGTQYTNSYPLYQGRASAAYGANVGTTGFTSGNITTGTAIGITTDGSKSGMVVDTSSLTLTCNIWQRTA